MIDSIRGVDEKLRCTGTQLQYEQSMKIPLLLTQQKLTDNARNKFTWGSMQSMEKIFDNKFTLDKIGYCKLSWKETINIR